MTEKFVFGVDDDKAKDIAQQLLDSPWQPQNRPMLEIPVSGPKCVRKYQDMVLDTCGEAGYRAYLIHQKSDHANAIRNTAGTGIVVYDAQKHPAFAPKHKPLGFNNCFYRPDEPGDTHALAFHSEAYPDPVHAGLWVNRVLEGKGLGPLMREVCRRIDEMLMEAGILSPCFRERDGAPTFETVNFTSLCFANIIMGYVPVAIIESEDQWRYCEYKPLSAEMETILKAVMKLNYHRSDTRLYDMHHRLPEFVRLKKDHAQAAKWKSEIKAEWTTGMNQAQCCKLATESAFKNAMSV